VTASAGRTELSHPQDPGTAHPPRLGPLVQYALLAGPLLSMLDSSIVNAAVEPIARELHASLTTVQWTVSGYLLALGAGLADTAYLARRFGTRPVYRVSVIAFTAASALCALAPDAAVLVAARVMQGLVAAPLVPLTFGAALLAGYAGWALRHDQPALDLSLARQKVPALSMALCALASVVTWAAVFLLPAFVQSVQGRSALAAGLTLLPQGLITGLSTALAPRLLTGLTVRVTVLAGFAVLAVASLGLVLVTATTPLWVIALILACRSVSIGLVINPLLQALTEPLRPEQLGDANTLFNTWQRIAGSFGIGLLAALYTTQVRTHGPVSALHLVGVVLAVIAGAGVLAALALPAVRHTALERD